MTNGAAASAPPSIHSTAHLDDLLRQILDLAPPRDRCPYISSAEVCRLARRLPAARKLLAALRTVDEEERRAPLGGQPLHLARYLLERPPLGHATALTWYQARATGTLLDVSVAITAREKTPVSRVLKLLEVPSEVYAVHGFRCTDRLGIRARVPDDEFKLLTEGLAAHLGPPTTTGSTSSAGDFRASFFSLRLASLHAELQVIPESIAEAMAAPGGPVSDAAYLDRKVVDRLVPVLQELRAAMETP